MEGRVAVVVDHFAGEIGQDEPTDDVVVAFVNHGWVRAGKQQNDFGTGLFTFENSPMQRTVHGLCGVVKISLRGIFVLRVPHLNEKTVFVSLFWRR